MKLLMYTELRPESQAIILIKVTLLLSKQEGPSPPPKILTGKKNPVKYICAKYNNNKKKKLQNFPVPKHTCMGVTGGTVRGQERIRGTLPYLRIARAPVYYFKLHSKEIANTRKYEQCVTDKEKILCFKVTIAPNVGGKAKGNEE